MQAHSSPRASALAALAAVLAGVVAQLGPTEDSNFSTQTGEFHYMQSYVTQEPELPYGMVTGRAALYRMATGVTKASMGVWFETVPADFATLVDPKFEAVLHSTPCDEGAGVPFQDPFACPFDGGATSGCDTATVAAHTGAAPLELRMQATMETIANPRNGNQMHRAVATFDWDLHIPPVIEGTDVSRLSMVLYDARNGRQMICADLPLDRQLDGIVFFVNQTLVENVPSVSEANIVLSETGTSTTKLVVANLRSGSKYPAALHSLPCVADLGGSPKYFRSAACIGNEGGGGCEDTAENTVDVTLSVPVGSSAATTQVVTDTLLRADAMSIMLYDCLDAQGQPDASGACPVQPLLMCIDMENEIPQVASSSSTSEFRMVSTTTGIKTTVGATTTFPVTTGFPATTIATAEPTAAPTTGEPSAAPTLVPTRSPVSSPTLEPSASPTADPSTPPTASPTVQPTGAPTEQPRAVVTFVDLDLATLDQGVLTTAITDSVLARCGVVVQHIEYAAGSVVATLFFATAADVAKFALVADEVTADSLQAYQLATATGSPTRNPTTAPTPDVGMGGMGMGDPATGAPTAQPTQTFAFTFIFTELDAATADVPLLVSLVRDGIGAGLIQLTASVNELQFSSDTEADGSPSVTISGLSSADATELDKFQTRIVLFVSERYQTPGPTGAPTLTPPVTPAPTATATPGPTGAPTSRVVVATQPPVDRNPVTGNPTAQPTAAAVAFGKGSKSKGGKVAKAPKAPKAPKESKDGPAFNPCGFVQYATAPVASRSVSAKAGKAGKAAKAPKAGKAGKASKGRGKGKTQVPHVTHATAQLDYAAAGTCCLDDQGPNSRLLGFSPRYREQTRSYLVAIIAGASGAAMIVLAAASYARRRYRTPQIEAAKAAEPYAMPEQDPTLAKEQRMAIDDLPPQDSYAMPMSMSSP